MAHEIDLANESHRKRLRETFSFHAHRELEDFERFYQAQCIWDETMAETVAGHFSRTGQRVFLVAGNGHVLYRDAIPDRIRRRVAARIAVVAPLTLDRSAGTRARRGRLCLADPLKKPAFPGSTREVTLILKGRRDVQTGC